MSSVPPNQNGGDLNKEEDLGQSISGFNNSSILVSSTRITGNHAPDHVRADEANYLFTLTTVSASETFNDDSPMDASFTANCDDAPTRPPLEIPLDIASKGFESIDEQNEPTFPIDVTESMEASFTRSCSTALEQVPYSLPVKGLEIIDENDAPTLLSGIPDAIDKTIADASITKLEVIDDETSSPDAFNFPLMEEDSVNVKSIKKVNQLKTTFKGSSASPGREHINDEEETATVRERGNNDFVYGVSPHSNQVYFDTDCDVDVAEAVSSPETIVNPNILERAESPVIHVPEAFLVEDAGSEEVVIATALKPPRPWWRQRRIQLLLGSVFAIVMGFAIYIGVSRRANQIEASLESFSPTTFPSSSPTTCASTVTIRNITSTLNIMHDPRIAVDGRNMIMVVRDGSIMDGRPMFALFYSLVNSVWQQVQKVDLVDQGYEYSVAISGDTIFIGLPSVGENRGTVLVYEKNDVEWEKIDDPFIRYLETEYTSLGAEVIIDGDFAAVGVAEYTVLVFTRDYGKWVQIDEVEGYCPCSIYGDTFSLMTYNYEISDWDLAIYRRNEEKDALYLIQEPFPAGYPHLSGNYLAYWDIDEYSDGRLEGLIGNGKWDLFLYYREGATMPYTFLERFNITDGNGAISIADDVLVVGGDGFTHIFTLEGDGDWKETITLDELYGSYYISGRNILAQNGDSAYSINIEDCIESSSNAADVLSTTPSLSIPPSASPSATRSMSPSMSFSPSMSPSVSMAPSSSSSPTETCYWVNITVVYDSAPDEVAWYLERIIDDQLVLVTWNKGFHGKLSDSKSMCLHEGKYGFIIGDHYGDGMCCEYGIGHYNVTVSNDVLVAEGGDFGYDKISFFTLPFIEGASSMPSFQSLLLPPSPSTVSPTPSRSWPPPSLTPSISESPTETCYLVEITVDYGSSFGDTNDFFQLIQMDDFGDDIQMFVSLASPIDGRIVQSGPICLHRGIHWFIFFGSYEESHFNITSSDHGVLIAEGRGTDQYDNTIFSIPYVPAEYV